ncbi:S-adenosyl-L-methionine-dependent methyltransferase [Xylogone sp. PMI_703]|nr:S-adenosyl-L-methionine-dependent methyltransferase [Xylogone sp. PMI_703]
MEVVESERYHKTDSAYLLPNDALEHARLDDQAVALAELLGGTPFLAPIKTMRNHVKKVADFGCGTGVATMQLASVFESASVYGVDISPIPEHVQKAAPANVSWVQGNILQADDTKPLNDAMRQVFAPGGLDYIFGRMLFMGINNWPKYYDVAARSLKSGGFIEHQDLDWTYLDDNSEPVCDKWEWYQILDSQMESKGFISRAGSQAADFMVDAGLEIISVNTYDYTYVPSTKRPVSPSFQRYVKELVAIFPEMVRKIMESKGMAEEEVEKMGQQYVRDVTSVEGLHLKYTVTVARKP